MNNDLHKKPLTSLISALGKNINANLELAHRIVTNKHDAVEYYLGTLTKPIVEYLSKKVMFRDVTGEFFEFISSPYDEKKQSFTWRPITYYTGKDDCTLKTYSSSIACRHFYKIREKEVAIKNSTREIIEYYDYESLLFLADTSTTEEEEDSALNEIKHRLRIAYSRLSEKEKTAIQLLVIDKVSGLEAFEHLKKYLNPRLIASGEFEKWSAKEKQNRVSVLKGRALDRLLKFFNETK